MPTLTVTTDLIESQQAATYFTNADRRVMIGLRATLEMLRLPVPEYARRKTTGVAPNPADAFSRFFVGLARGHLTACNHDVSPVRAA